MSRLTIPCLIGVLLLTGCARKIITPTDQEEDIPAEAAPEEGSPTLRSLPDFYWAYDQDKYRCDPYIQVAARFQWLGPEAGLKALTELAREESPWGHRVVILCRMLFTRKAGGEFRRPGLGSACFLGDTDYPDWPLEPIEVVDGVPFLVVRGYGLAGWPQSSSEYLRYCVAHCEWNSSPFKPRTAAEKAKALDKLIHSARWKKPLQADERAFLERQVE